MGQRLRVRFDSSWNFSVSVHSHSGLTGRAQPTSSDGEFYAPVCSSTETLFRILSTTRPGKLKGGED